MQSINEPIMSCKNKRKKILIISSDEICRTTIMNKLTEHNYLVKRKNIDQDEILIDYNYSNKVFHLTISESTGYETNTNNINLNVSSNYIINV
jgi:hypothetical protein